MVALFFLVVVVIGLSQVMYFTPQPTDTDPGGEEKLKGEISQLKAENAGLKEENSGLKKANEKLGSANQDNARLSQKLKELEDTIALITHEDGKEGDEGDVEALHVQIQQLVSQNSNLTKQLQELAAIKEEMGIPPTMGPNGDEDLSTVITNYDNLVSLVKNFNTYGAIRNADKFTLEEGFIPIVIRVFNKHEYFGYALENYRKVKGIEKTMIIVSHDGIFPEMFKLVQNIDFCQVKQIIHPYSGHLLTNRFPGPDKNLPHHLDQYGNPRPFPHTALKHHFWWHLNFVWDQFLPHHKGDMVFMEEDHVATYDFYLTTKALAKIRDEKCKDCFNAKIHEHGHKGSDFHGVFLSHDMGNVGMVIPRRSWEQLRAAGKDFCSFDDYNWDWSVTNLVARRQINTLSLTASYPRAEHFGKCGTHAKSSVCSIAEEDRRHFEEINHALELANGGDWSEYTFNDRPVDGMPAQGRGWGGWAHPRDIEHCIAQIKQTT